MLTQATIKTIGVNGQISLGKQYAGQQVLVEEQEEGVWLIRTADVIPRNERWLHEPEHRAKLAAALSWATDHDASESGNDAVLERLTGRSDNDE